MAIRYRRMKQEDADTCVEIIATHAVVRLHYGKDISRLASAIRAVLPLESVRAFVFEEPSADGSMRMLAGGILGFVTDEFTQRAKQPPYFWMGPELSRLTLAGKTPFLFDRQLREANATHGLNEVVWFCAIRQEEMSRAEVRMHTMEGHYSEVRGFRLKELLAQATTAEELEHAIRSGGCLLGSDGQPNYNDDTPSHDIIRRPHILCVTKELMNKNFGSYISMLFVHQAPRIGFSPSEQRLLERALRGGMDEELAKELQISTSAIKKTWRSIYNRVDRSSTGIVPKTCDDHDYPERGKGKKHLLLSYIREHPAPHFFETPKQSPSKRQSRPENKPAVSSEEESQPTPLPTPMKHALI